MYKKCSDSQIPRNKSLFNQRDSFFFNLHESSILGRVTLQKTFCYPLLWKKTLDDGLKVGVLFIDLRKAFDCADRIILGEQLKALGVAEDL